MRRRRAPNYSAAYTYDLGGRDGVKVGIKTLDIEGFHTPAEAREIAKQIIAAADEADRLNGATPSPVEDPASAPAPTRDR